MSVLVDSSVWIDYFRDPRQGDALDDLIEQDLVVVDDLILAELLPPLRLRRERRLIGLLGELARPPMRIDWDGIVELQVTCMRNGLNLVGIPDLIVAQHAMQNDLELLSNDRHFARLSQVVPLSLYQG